jgi:signal transduction histidine kinase
MNQAVTQAMPDTELERLRQELDAEKRKLVEAQKMVAVGRLMAGITHEIKTPIGSILSNNDVILRSLETLSKLLAAALEKNAPPPPKALDIVDTMKSLAQVDKIACERISGIIRSLKTFARVDEGSLRKADLHELIENTMKLSGCEFRRRVQVVTDFGDLPEVECYPQLLSQAFLNLLVNAGQAISGEGKITVQTRLEDGCARVSISDTGAGIRPEDRPRIFGAGFSTKPIGEGTGLGLAITREILVDKHHGTIDFESEVGVGTTFHVRIPIDHPKEKTA